MPFNFSPTPQLHFGVGKISLLPGILKTFGSKALLVTGAHSFVNSAHGTALLEQLRSTTELDYYIIDREPTPELIDDAIRKFSGNSYDVVVAIGGGSVLDAGKAISAMLLLKEPLKDYLEGVGTKSHPGIKVSYVAVPTTAGTGSEATKNAVLSHIGENGYKKSLRHNNFVPDITIVDPALTISCPPAVTATSGMDAFTQLLESYVSTASNPVADALAYEGLTRIAKSLIRAYKEGIDMEARADMALASYLSGITLANAGLGVVHGFASSIGGYFDIPHGLICSALMAPANKVTVQKLRTEHNEKALLKYAMAGKIFAGTESNSNNYYTDFLLQTIEQYTHELNIPSLADKGVTPQHFKKIADITDNKNNPAFLTHEEMIEILEQR